MTPKIVFTYSWIYDRNWEAWSKAYRTWPYPSTKKTLSYMKKMEPVWRRQEKKILGEMSRITGLPWKKKTITAYVVGSARPFSDPLTVGTRKDPDIFIDMLVHECIHQLFVQNGNLKLWKKGWGNITRKYKNETVTTRIHVPLHAIHEHIYRKFFSEERLSKEIKASTLKDYKQAWAIVQKEGYKNIIAGMKKR